MVGGRWQKTSLWRLRYGLNISEDEMRNIILEKEEGKPLKKILFTR
jgi:hypothetical protein